MFLPGKIYYKPFFLCRLILTSLYAPTKIPATSGGPMVDFEYKQMSDGNQHGNSLLLYEKKREEKKLNMLN